MCQVQAGAYVSLLTPGETEYSDCHPRKTTLYSSLAPFRFLQDLVLQLEQQPTAVIFV